MDYDLCSACGTYRSRAPALDYGDYWEKKGRPSVWEQAWNVDMHAEGGVCKNRFVLDRIESDRGAALDIGCAPGRLLYWLKHAARFSVVVGVEPDERCHKEVRRVGCFEGVLLSGLFPQATRLESLPPFDYVCALDVFEHSPEPEGFLEECARIIAPGGQLFLMTPLADGIKKDSREFRPGEHLYIHSSKNLRQMLQDVGLSARFDRWCVGHETVSARKT